MIGSSSTTPAQADEKALEEIVRRIREPSPHGRQHFTLTTGEAVDLIRPNRAALRPEVEPVADPDRILKDALFVNLAANRESAGYRGVRVEGGRYASIIFRIHEPGESLGIASPPAPAVKVKALREAFDAGLEAAAEYVERIGDYGHELAASNIRAMEFPAALLPPEEAQAAAPAEALPSQTSGAWEWRSRLKGGAWDAWEQGRFGQEIPPFADVQERWTGPALAKPASEPAGGGVEKRAFSPADIYQIINPHRDDKGYLPDYRISKVCREIAALSSPASSSPAEPDGVEAPVYGMNGVGIYGDGFDPVTGGFTHLLIGGQRYAKAQILAALSSAPAQAGSFVESGSGVRVVNDNGKRWRVESADGRWEIKPTGHIDASEAKDMCERIAAALADAHSKPDPHPEPDKER